MRLVVTGGAGKLGAAVVARAADAGHEVLALDRVPRVADQPHPAVTGRVVDLLDFAALCAACAGADAVVHTAAYVNPGAAPEPVVHDTNVTACYGVLAAAERTGILRVCIASSVNAIGGYYSREPRYDVFPVDESHPCYAEDAYSLSKWECEQQAAAFARRVPAMGVTCLRLHALQPDDAVVPYRDARVQRSKDLWGWTPMGLATRACLAAVERDRTGCDVVYVVADRTCLDVPSAELHRRFYPDVPLRAPLEGHRSFFSGDRLAVLLARSG